MTVTVMIAPVTLTGVNVLYCQVVRVVVQPLCYLFCDLFFCKAAMNDGDYRSLLVQAAKHQNCMSTDCSVKRIGTPIAWTIATTFLRRRLVRCIVLAGVVLTDHGPAVVFYRASSVCTECTAVCSCVKFVQQFISLCWAVERLQLLTTEL